jgi:acyl carrier protein
MRVDMQIDNELKAVVLEALGLDDWDIVPETLAYEVPHWDSLNHVAVITAIEKKFGIRFTPREVVELENVGDLDRLVASKRATK